MNDSVRIPVSQPIEQRLTAPTSSGSIEIVEARRSSVCTGCGVRGGGLLELHVDRGRSEEKTCIPICGNCVATAVAVHLRRRHGLAAKPGPIPDENEKQ